MSQISSFRNPWRDILLSQPASFRGVVFHVEQGGRTSGRRTALHEYPKRNLPYAEDMGRHAIRFQFSAYLIYRPSNPLYEYTSQRTQLYDALEADEAAKLVHPVFAPGGVMVMCERYTMTESRERGGYTQFELQFVEAGSPTKAGGVATNTKSVVLTRAASLEGVWTQGSSPLTGLTQRSVV
jgi:prophage DNA circulation protein